MLLFSGMTMITIVAGGVVVLEDTGSSSEEPEPPKTQPEPPDWKIDGFPNIISE